MRPTHRVGFALALLTVNLLTSLQAQAQSVVAFNDWPNPGVSSASSAPYDNQDLAWLDFLDITGTALHRAGGRSPSTSLGKDINYGASGGRSDSLLDASWAFCFTVSYIYAPWDDTLILGSGNLSMKNIGLNDGTTLFGHTSAVYANPYGVNAAGFNPVSDGILGQALGMNFNGNDVDAVTPHP